MTERHRTYATPAAFRRALTDRLREIAANGRWTLSQLQRQIAYDRLLERLYVVDQSWLVKGATALLARQIGVRGTVDVDVYRNASTEQAEAEIRKAAALDLGDWFRFEVASGRPVSAGGGSVRFRIAASVGATAWASFGLDVVGSDITMTGNPDAVPALARVMMPDVEQHGYRAYPLVDHIADKIVATFQFYGTQQMPSTRYKDLVDLVAIATSASVDAEDQLAALRSEATRRGVELPAQFDVPDRPLWERDYPRAASDSLLPMAKTLDDALLIVSPFADPLLDGSASGKWDPETMGWRGEK